MCSFRAFESEANNKMKTQHLIYIILAAITIYGLVTGRYLFLVFVLPLGLLWSRKDKKE